MVSITDYSMRENENGEKFCVLHVSGQLEAVKSKETNKVYFTVRRTTVPATFPESVAKSMIGQQLPGSIKKVFCDPYTFTTESGEEVEIDFTYEFSQESDNVLEDVVLG